MGIYSITSPDPTLADDISCIALSPAAIQNILTTAFLGAEPVYLSNTYNHLGIHIHLHSKLVHTKKIANACRKGRDAYCALKILREHLNSDTISRLYTRVVLPSIVYGCELWYDLRRKD